MAKLIPYISCRNALEVIDFYVRAFGATVQNVIKRRDGKILHAVGDIQGALVYVMDEIPEHGGKWPLMLGGVPLLLALEVDAYDALFRPGGRIRDRGGNTARGHVLGPALERCEGSGRL